MCYHGMGELILDFLLAFVLLQRQIQIIFASPLSKVPVDLHPWTGTGTVAPEMVRWH